MTTTYGNNTSYLHPSVRHNFVFLRLLAHIFMRRVCLQITRGRFQQSVFKIKIGPGAGYVTGLTIFLALGCKMPMRAHKSKRVQLGITRNANAVPFVSY